MIRLFKSLIYLSVILSLLSSCKKDASTEIQQESFGLSLTQVSGDNQTGDPDKLFSQPLVVKVTDASGKGVKDIGVRFIEASNTSLYITTASPKTDASGYAQTDVRAPAVYNASSKIKACLMNSDTCTTFTLASSATVENAKFQVWTDNMNAETAGVPFGFTVRIVGLKDNALIDVDGDIMLEWTFITQSSWGGNAPTLMPLFYNCTFTDGVCIVPPIVTLTDARQPTQLFMGDGDLGYVDVFSHEITVQPGATSKLLITDKSGGPTNNAVVYNDTILSTDSSPIDLYGAFVDSVGNFVSDATAPIWTSNKATEITPYLASIGGGGVRFTPTKVIEFPGDGTITATQTAMSGSTGNITIDPGLPVDIKVIPKTVDTILGGSASSLTRTAGYSFQFDLHVLDAKGNIVGRRSTDSGFDGSMMVNFAWNPASYLTGSEPSGGTTPYFGFQQEASAHPSDRQDNFLRFVTFNQGRATAINNYITFWDGSASPEITITTPAFGVFSSVVGSTTFTTQVGPPDHINIRSAAGGGGNPLCPADIDAPNNKTLLEYTTELYNESNYECTGLIFKTSDPSINIYGVVEDIAGNWIADLNGSGLSSLLTVVGPCPAGSPTCMSDFKAQLTPLVGNNAVGFPITLTPDTVTTNTENYFIIQGTYNGVSYQEDFRGDINPGVLSAIKLVSYNGGSTAYTGTEIAVSSNSVILVQPLDAKGNQLSTTFNENATITHNGASLSNGPNGQVPSIYPQGATLLNFGNSITMGAGNGAASEATLTGNIFPKAGETFTLTVTLNPSGITATETFTIRPGALSYMKTYLDGPYPAGTDITGTNITINTDPPYPQIFANGFDLYGNLTINPPTPTWTTPIKAPTDVVSGIIATGSQTPFVPDKPGTIQVRADFVGSSTWTAQTGIITVEPGVPNKAVVTHATTVTAGNPEDLTVTIVDAKDNTCTQYTGNPNVSFSVFNNSPTHPPFNLDHSVPSSGTGYTFTNGVRTFTGGLTFFNAIQTPYVVANLSNIVVGGTPYAITTPLPTNTTVLPNVFNHMFAQTENIQVNVGDNNTFTIKTEDAFGNHITSGNPVTSETITFNITSILGAEDINQTNLGSPNPSDLTSANQKTLQGQLNSGQGTIRVASTKAGQLTVSAIPNVTAVPGTNIFEPLTVLPLTTVASIAWNDPTRPQTPVSTFATWNDFKVNLLDVYGNIIDVYGNSNNSDDPKSDIVAVALTKTPVSPSIVNNPASVNVVNGQALFSNLQFYKAGTFDLHANVTTSLLPDAQPTTLTKTITVQLGTASEAVMAICDMDGCDGDPTDQVFVEGQSPASTVNGTIVTGTPFSTGSVQAGTQFKVEIRAMDSAFNTRTDYTGPVGLSPNTAPVLDCIVCPTNFTAGVAVFTVRMRAVGTGITLTPVTGLDNNPSAPFNVTYGTANRLVVKLPGQTHVPGGVELPQVPAPTAPVISGNPTDQTAGTPFNVNVYALDAYNNIVTNYNSGSANISLNHFSDAFASSPAAQQMTNGTLTFSVTNYRADDADVHHLIPTCGSCAGISTFAVSSKYDVSGGAATQYAYVLPGITPQFGQLPTVGNDTDYKNFVRFGTDTPTAQNTDTAFNVTVYALDNYFNRDPSYAGSVSITTSDPNTLESLPTGPTNFSAGVATYSVNPITAGSGRTISVTAAGLSNANEVGAVNDAPIMSYNVSPGAAQKYVVIFSDYQTLQPGNVNVNDPDGVGPLKGAKSDSTTQNRTAGSTIPVSVYLTDNDFNIVTSVNQTVTLTPSVANSTVTPIDSSTSGDGVATFNVSTYLVGSGYTLTPSGGGYAAVPSTNYNVVADLSTKYLLVRLPGQTFVPGKALLAQAITGTPLKQTQSSGFPFGVEIIATDKYFNQLNVSDTVSLDSLIGAEVNGSGLPLPQSIALTSGSATMTVYHTANNASQNFDTDNGTNTGLGYTGTNSTSYQVFETLQDPTLALSDPTTSNTSYIRQSGSNAVSTAITTGNSNSLWWCISQTQSTRPVGAGTANNRGTCTGGSGTVGNNYWINVKPTLATVSAGAGLKNFYIWSSDDALNVSLNQVTDSITLDSTAPTTPTFVSMADASGGPAGDPTAISDESTLNISITTPGDAVSYCLVDTTSASSPSATWNNCPNSDPVTGGIGGNNHGDADGNIWRAIGTLPTSVQLNFSGNRKISVFVKDAAENVSAAASRTIIYDSANPTFLSTNHINGITGNADTTQDNLLGTTGAPTVHWDKATDVETLVSYDLRILDIPAGTDQCTAANNLATATYCSGSLCSYNFTGCNLADGSYVVELKAKDQANHIVAADNNNFAFTVDKIAPSAFTITGVDGGAGSQDTVADNKLLDNIDNVRVHWGAVTGETSFKVSIRNSANSADICGPATVAQDATSYQFTACNLNDSSTYYTRVIALDNASNSSSDDFQFTTAQGIDHFLVEILDTGNNPVTTLTAGVAYKVRLTAKDGLNATITSYTGAKTINWSTTGGNGNNSICLAGGTMTPEFSPTALTFASGVGTTTATLKLKLKEGAITVTGTEQNTGNSGAGSSSLLNVLAGTQACVRIENTSGGAAELTTQNLASTDDTFTAHAATYDAFGNFITNPSGATWSTIMTSGTTSLNYLATPATGAITQLTGSRKGNGNLQMTFGAHSDTVAFTVPTGTTTWTTATNDDSTNVNALLANNNITAVHYWSAVNDPYDPSWRTTLTSRSWYTESHSATRGERSEFPNQVFLVGSSSGLEIIDANNNELWMRFTSGASNAIDSDYGTINDIVALNGKIYVSMDSGATGGLIIIDFPQDKIYMIDSANQLRYNGTISARNSGSGTVVDTKFPLSSGARLYALDIVNSGTTDYVAFGSNNGVNLLKIPHSNIITYTVTKYTDATTNPVTAVAFATDRLYYGETGTGLHRVALPISANFTPAITYDQSTTNARIDSLTFNDLDVTQITGNYHITVATDRGLTVVNEGSNSSKSYSSLGSGLNPFAGSLSLSGTNGYLDIPNAGTLTDTMSIQLWFKPAGSVTNTVLAEKGDPGVTNGAWSLGFNGSDQLEFSIRHNGVVYTSTSVTSTWNSNQWYHVAAQVGDDSATNGRIEIWINGTSEGNDTTIDIFTPALDIDSSNTTVGGTSGGGHFNGFIDELRIDSTAQFTFGGAVTVSGIPLVDSGSSIHLFHFNETSGSTADDTIQVANGTLTNNGIGYSTPLFAGTSINVTDLVTNPGYGVCHIITSGSWSELSSIDTTAVQSNSSTSFNPSAIGIYHVDGALDSDTLIGLSTSGVRLDRR